MISPSPYLLQVKSQLKVGGVGEPYLLEVEGQLKVGGVGELLGIAPDSGTLVTASGCRGDQGLGLSQAGFWVDGRQRDVTRTL